MKTKHLFDDAIMKFLDNFIIAISFSGLMLGVIFLEAHILSLFACSPKSFFIILFLEALSILILIAFLTRINKALSTYNHLKLLFITAVWAIVSSLEILLIYKVYFFIQPESVAFLLVFAFFHLLFYGAKILSVCNNGFLMIRRASFVKFVLLCAGSTLLLLTLSIFSFTFVNPGKMIKIAPPQEIISKRENLLFLAVLLIFIPLYTILISVFYECVNENAPSKKE